MYTFILITVLVTIISLCVFKNRFWENRYLILLIIAAASLVSMTTINFSVRGSLPHTVEVSTSKELIPLYTKHSQLPTDSTLLDTILPNFGEISHNPRNDFFLKSETDTVKQIKSHIIFYEYGGLYVGWNADDNKRVNRTKSNGIYFGVSDNPRYEVRILRYDASNTSWVNGFSLPDVRTIKVLYIPQHEYDVLKDEYKQEIPY